MHQQVIPARETDAMSLVILASLSAFIAVLAVFGAAACIYFDLAPSKAEDRLRGLTGTKTGDLETLKLLKDGAGPTGPGIWERWRLRFAQKFKLFSLLEQAGFPNAGKLFSIATLACGVLAIPAGVLLRAPAALVPLLAVAGAFVPLVSLLAIRQYRFKHFSRQLPDAMELISRALRSGNSLVAAMQCVADDMLAPISTEFQVFCRTQALGTSVEQGLTQMCQRVPSADLQFFTTCVTMQREMGGNLAEMCDKIAHIIRDRYQILGQVQALTGEGRLSGSILLALPIVLFVVVYRLSPEYVMLLFTDPVGRKMLAVAGVLQVLGALAINHIVKIKV